MSDNQNNTLIKAFLVVILGTVAFGLLFNMLKGGDNMMDMMSSMNNSGGMSTMGSAYNMGGMNSMDNMSNASMNMAMGSGNTLNGILGGVLILLVKFLMIVLVVAVTIGVIVWIKNNFFKDSNFQFKQVINNDPIIKTVSVITLGILAIVLVAGLFGSFFNTGMGYNFSMNGNMGGGNSITSSITSLISLLVQILSFILVLSLILAVFAYLKKQYDSGAFSFNTAKPQGGAAPNTQNSIVLPEGAAATTTEGNPASPSKANGNK